MAFVLSIERSTVKSSHLSFRQFTVINRMTSSSRARCRTSSRAVGWDRKLLSRHEKGWYARDLWYRFSRGILCRQDGNRQAIRRHHDRASPSSRVPNRGAASVWLCHRTSVSPVHEYCQVTPTKVIRSINHLIDLYSIPY
jgi:hypothetical protein